MCPLASSPGRLRIIFSARERNLNFSGRQMWGKDNGFLGYLPPEAPCPAPPGPRACPAAAPSRTRPSAATRSRGRRRGARPAPPCLCPPARGSTADATRSPGSRPSALVTEVTGECQRWCLGRSFTGSLCSEDIPCLLLELHTPARPWPGYRQGTLCRSLSSATRC